MVDDLTEDDMIRLAAESEETATERERCEQKRTILEAGYRDLKRLDKLHSVIPGKSPSFYVAGVTIAQPVMTLKPLIAANILMSPFTDIQVNDNANLGGDVDEDVVASMSSDFG